MNDRVASNLVVAATRQEAVGVEAVGDIAGAPHGSARVRSDLADRCVVRGGRNAPVRVARVAPRRPRVHEHLGERAVRAVDVLVRAHVARAHLSSRSHKVIH